MSKLVVLTADPADPTYSGMWRPFFDRLAAPLREAGLTVEAAPWTEPLPDADAYTPLMAWGYHKRYGDWLRFLDRMAGRRLINDAEALRWNGERPTSPSWPTRAPPPRPPSPSTAPNRRTPTPPSSASASTRWW